MDEHFQALLEWLNLYGYPILFAIVFAENTGLPVPGETVVLASSLLASRPDSRLEIGWVIVVTVLAAVLGDNLGFWLGRRWARNRLEQGKRFLFLTPGVLKSVEGYFERYGTLTVFFARFVTGLRVVAALAAGTSRMTWPRFVLANAAGAIAWAVSMASLGYFFGHSWQMLHKWMGRGGLIILGCVVVLIGLPYLWRRARRLPEGTLDRLLRSQLWQGLLAAVVVVLCLGVLVLLTERHGGPPREDRAVRRWVAFQHAPVVDTLAAAGSYLGSLPVVTLLAGVLMVWSWRSGRPGREPVAILWALVASETLGLLLLGVLRDRGVETSRAFAWPFGFAGLAPLRGTAVFGMMAQVVKRRVPAWGIRAPVLAGVLVLLIGFSVLWAREQYLTEVLVEVATGSVVLFAGLWGLEGYGVGPRSGAAQGVVPTPVTGERGGSTPW